MKNIFKNLWNQKYSLVFIIILLGNLIHYKPDSYDSCCLTAIVCLLTIILSEIKINNEK